MENNSRYLEACGAGEQSGLYYTCVNSYLTASELAYIVANSESRILITSVAKPDVAREVLKECPKVELCIVADGGGESERIVGLQQATAGLPKTPIPESPSAPPCYIRRARPAGRKAYCGPRALSRTDREMGRHPQPAGAYKRPLRDRYWGDKTSRIP
jgi:acyl-CoA synthetase (AMP-forming)/AMP-acid ligase II